VPFWKSASLYGRADKPRKKTRAAIREDRVAQHITGKSILITGAGNGFGRLTAQQAAALGGLVTCVDVRADAAEATAQDIRTQGGQAIAVPADVSMIDQMRTAVEQAVQAFGSIDILVNNAGIMPLAYLADHEVALDAWNRCIDINFKGVINGTVAAYDRMVAQGQGHIVNLSSIYGNHPVVGASVYGATKAAVDHFSHAVRQEARGVIKVTVIKPTGVLATGLTASVVNKAAGMGIVGHNGGEFGEVLKRFLNDDLNPDELDPENIAYATLEAGYIADAIIHAINQPLGVMISDITVRASGDYFIL